MKKIGIVLLVCLLITGCGLANASNEGKGDKNPTNTTPVLGTTPLEGTNAPKETDKYTEKPTEPQYKFVVNGQTIYLNEEASTLSVLGDALETVEKESIVYNGTEKIYQYDGFSVHVVPVDGKDIIEGITISSASVTTEEGVKIGDEISNVTSVYKDASESKDSIYMTTLGETSLRFIELDGKVAAINYFTTKAPTALTSENTEPSMKYVFETTFYLEEEFYDYTRYVEGVDDVDQDVTIVVDHSKVKEEDKGVYNVTYYAFDRAGNHAKRTVEITVADKPDSYVTHEEMDELADQVLASILSDGMTQKEKQTAIYKWVRENIRYIAHSDKEDWVQTAYESIRKKKGDCFGYYAVGQELLYRAGIDSLRVKEKDGTLGSTHYWSMVDSGYGWYHYDTTPRKAGGVFDMVTDEELLEYSKAHKNSHYWDRDSYPATPTEKYKG